MHPPAHPTLPRRRGQVWWVAGSLPQSPLRFEGQRVRMNEASVLCLSAQLSRSRLHHGGPSKLVRFRDLALLWRFVFRDVVCTLCETLLINTLVVAVVFYNLRCAAPLLVEESVPLSIHSLLQQTVFVP